MENLKELVLKAQEGDEDSFQQLYETFYKRVYYIALKISNYCDADAQDIAQDTFMEIHRSIANLQKPENFKSWMIRILISKSSHKFRDNRDLYMDPDTLLKMEGHLEKREYMIPGVALNNNEDKQILLRLVDQLKPKQKEVLVLQYFENMSIKEIADALAIPEGTVKTRIHNAKEKLKEYVCAYEEQEERKLSFHISGLEAALVSAFLFEYEAWNHKAVVHVKRKKFKTDHSFLYPLLVSSCVITIGIAGFCGYREWKKTDAANNYSITNEKRFESVIYRDQVITNCRDAYYTLKEWASNPKRMALRPQKEKEEIKPVYEALKKYRGVYYEKLVDDQWAIAFEAN